MMYGSLSKSKSKPFFLALVGILLLISAPFQIEVDAAEATTTRQGTRPIRGNHQEPLEHHQQQQQQQRQRSQQHSPRPNFVIVLADDLDWTLGGANASTLSKTRRLIGGELNTNTNTNNNNNNGEGGGKTFSNWFVQTPVCCASRAELFTGRVYHNLKVPAMSFNSSFHKGCMHIDVQDDKDHIFWNKWYFSNFFTDTAIGANRYSNNATTTATNTKTKTKTNYNNLNYKVGLFGKHLNTHNPSDFLPNGVDEMLINGGGEYLNPTFTHAFREKRKRTDTNTNNMNSSTNSTDDGYELKYDLKKSFNNCTESTGMPCYSTSVIGNASLAWIRKQVLPGGDDYDYDYDYDYNDDDDYDDDDESKSKSEIGNRPPFFALISVKAPHIQDGGGFPMAIPAPWYENTTIPEQFAPRTPNYNATTTRPNNDKDKDKDYHHWLVRKQPPLSDLEATMVDDLYVSRLKTLLSIDDLVEGLVEELETLGVLNNTYIVFTSDNGYRLGQFRMPQCKLHPYENDVRVPMMIRGPGIGTRTRTVGTPPITAAATSTNHQHHHHQHHYYHQHHHHHKHNNSGNSTRNRHEEGSSSSSRDTKTKTSTTDHSAAAAAVFSHVHLMPTLLGLATGMHDSQDILPDTMDGTNLARLLLDADADFDVDFNVGSGDQDEDETFYGTNTSTPVFPSKAVSSSSPSPSQSISLLIEYTSLGNVVRYQHLIDTYNHSFVALRIMPRDHLMASTTHDDKRLFANKTLPERTAAGGGGGGAAAAITATSSSSSGIMIETISNLKYIEFRDSRVDWTNTETPPLERELYDLDQDPYELDNLLFGGGGAIAIAMVVPPATPPPPFPRTRMRITPSLLRALEAKTKRLIRCRGDDCRREHSTGLDLDNFGVAPEEQTS